MEKEVKTKLIDSFVILFIFSVSVFFTIKLIDDNQYKNLQINHTKLINDYEKLQLENIILKDKIIFNNMTKDNEGLKCDVKLSKLYAKCNKQSYLNIDQIPFEVYEHKIIGG